ncbi:hypothetical protein POL68_26105 [Stigmatella sp. ncwal1]|uniref:Tetratricopeptide repeat protein n=1 Tax=Stigmatella ashevillensis TaxID=2995309 RepID=A0ABT5DEC2_9BACT|nr:hypothetical protein [Stigmatella ashevillena]MDC0711968.1 hypothetical protein [Stigmatella ashevillena]
MGIRELKEVAHEQFVRGKFAQCAQTYGQVLRLVPKDPNMRVRHAEACRRSGDRLQAIASYRAAAELLLELGCESRARGALKAALELDPKDPLLLADIAALAPQGALLDLERASVDFCEGEGPLPSLEATVGFAPLPSVARTPAAPAISPARLPALPPLHRALPMAPLTRPPAPPVLFAVPQPAPRTLSAKHAVIEEDITPTVRPFAPSPLVRMPAELPPPEPTPPEALRPPDIRPVVPRCSLAPSVPAPPPLPKRAMEVRRLSPTTLAFRLSPQDSWVLVRARTPLDMHMVEDLEKFRPQSSDFTLDITVEPQDEDPSHAVS